MKSKCELANEYRMWSNDKKADRLFMSCPACGEYGLHVEVSK